MHTTEDNVTLILAALVLLFIARPAAAALYARDVRRNYERRSRKRELMRAGLLSSEDEFHGRSYLHRNHRGLLWVELRLRERLRQAFRRGQR